MFFPILRKQLSSGQVAVILGRLIVIELLLLTVGILAVRHSYYTYQNHSSFSSQGLNSDLLFPSVPLALSSAIINNNAEQLEQILDANYPGLKGLIITDRDGKNITNYSHENSKNSQNWTEDISIDSLNSYPHHLLVNPLALPTNSYYLSRKEERNYYEKLIAQELILGRVYYIRDVSEKFSQELLQWLQNPWQNNSRFPIYNLTILLFIIGGLFIWSFSEYFLSYRFLMLKEKEQLSQRLKLEKELVKREIEKRKIADENQEILKNQQIQMQKEIAILQDNLKEKVVQNSRLIKEREKEQKKLEELETYQSQKIKNLQTIIKEYEQEILILEVWQEKSQELEEVKEEKNNLLSQLEEQQQLEEERINHIQSLREKIEILITQNQENENKINDLQDLQLSNKQSIEQREKTIKKEFERQINLVKLESQYAFEEAQTIEQEKERLILQNKKLRETLNSEIEKNKYLEFVLESYKEGNDTIIDEADNDNDNYPSIPTSYLTNISSRKAIKALQKLGFQKDRHKGDHYILRKTETHTITVPIPHPRQELNPLTLKNILIQTNTCLEDFLDNL